MDQNKFKKWIIYNDQIFSDKRSALQGQSRKDAIKDRRKLQNESTETNKKLRLLLFIFFINLKEIHKSLAYEYILLQCAIQTILGFLDFTQVLHIKYLAFQNSVFRKSYGRISIDDELYEG